MRVVVPVRRGRGTRRGAAAPEGAAPGPGRGGRRGTRRAWRPRAAGRRGSGLLATVDEDLVELGAPVLGGGSGRRRRLGPPAIGDLVDQHTGDELGRAASLPNLARGELAAPGSRVGDSQAQHRSAVVVEPSAPSSQASKRRSAPRVRRGGGHAFRPRALRRVNARRASVSSAPVTAPPRAECQTAVAPAGCNSCDPFSCRKVGAGANGSGTPLA